MPSLRAAKNRAAFAARRLMVLEAARDQLVADNAGAVVTVTGDRATIEAGQPWTPAFSWPDTKPLRNRTECELVASEVLHHLRVSLDYLAYQLVWLESGVEKAQTAFPICNTESAWNRDSRARLPGVRQAYLDALREVQPFRGGAWLATLRDLNNQDKHRVISDIARQNEGQFNTADLTPDPLDATRLRLDMPADLPKLVLDDGTDVVDTLTTLAHETVQLLMSVQAWFGESDALTLRDA